MKFVNKLKWILGISMVFLLIITTNLIDRSNFNQIRNSVVSIYDDRLVAKDYILEMTRLIHEKEVATVSADSTFFMNKNTQVNQDLDKLASLFESTKLTYEEQKAFDDFKGNLAKLKESERMDFSGNNNQNEVLKEHLKSMKGNLRLLSKIQLKEGGRQMLISKRAIDSIELFTHIEIYFLIFLAIVVQILVMYKPQE